MSRTEVKATLVTDAGMHVIWDRSHFQQVRDYETWSTELEEDADILRHIRAGHIVPINIHSDGAWAFTIRADPVAMPPLTDDEQDRVVVRSERYRFDCHGYLHASGIEHVNRKPGDRVATVAIPARAYDVIVHLMDYDNVQHKTADNPDFIITVGPAETATPRQSDETFERPG